MTHSFDPEGGEQTGDIVRVCALVPCLDVGRDYFQFQAVKQGNKIFLAHGPKGPVGARSWPGTVASFERWCAGTTGWPLVDANMRELKVVWHSTRTGVLVPSACPVWFLCAG